MYSRFLHGEQVNLSLDFQDWERELSGYGAHPVLSSPSAQCTLQSTRCVWLIKLECRFTSEKKIMQIFGILKIS